MLWFMTQNFLQITDNSGTTINLTDLTWLLLEIWLTPVEITIDFNQLLVMKNLEYQLEVFKIMTLKIINKGILFWAALSEETCDNAP